MPFLKLPYMTNFDFKLLYYLFSCPLVLPNCQKTNLKPTISISFCQVSMTDDNEKLSNFHQLESRGMNNLSALNIPQPVKHSSLEEMLIFCWVKDNLCSSQTWWWIFSMITRQIWKLKVVDYSVWCHRCCLKYKSK